MTQIIVAEVHPALDGEYEFEVTGFTNFELHAIKLATGLTAGDFSDAYERMDNDVVVAMGMVALMRAGKITSRTPWASQEMDALWAAPIGAVYLTEPEEDDAGPPEIGLDESVGDVVKNGSSGESSSLPSESPELDPSLTGDRT